jgi:hypothetical protein
MANLSGTWMGTYWQRGIPTRFELTMVQGGNSISGRITDDNALGEASMVGEVIGRSLSFTKQYLMSSRHKVRYRGTVSEIEDFMSGQWQIGVFDSGNWEAYRSEDNLTLKVESSQSQEVLIPAQSAIAIAPNYQPNKIQ